MGKSPDLEQLTMPEELPGEIKSVARPQTGNEGEGESHSIKMLIYRQLVNVCIKTSKLFHLNFIACLRLEVCVEWNPGYNVQST